MLNMSQLLVVPVLVSLVLTVSARGDDRIEAILARVEQARTDYEADCSMLRELLLQSLEREITSAQQAGKFERVTTLGAERDAFIEKATLPEAISTVAFTNGMSKARDRLEGALVRARKELTQAGGLEDAKAIDDDLTELKRTSPGTVVKSRRNTQRVLWMKANRTQYFLKGVGADWFEKAENGKRAEIFSERARTKEYIELRHNTLPITIRLGSTSIFVRLNDTDAFVEAKDAGTWIQP